MRQLVALIERRRRRGPKKKRGAKPSPEQVERGVKDAKKFLDYLIDPDSIKVVGDTAVAKVDGSTVTLHRNGKLTIKHDGKVTRGSIYVPYEDHGDETHDVWREFPVLKKLYFRDD